MSTLNPNTFIAVVDSLVPHCQDADSRKAWISRALWGCEVLNQIKWTGAAKDFAFHLAQKLVDYGECEANKPAIVKLLGELKNSVGLVDQAKIDTLISQILKVNTPAQSDEELFDQLKKGQLPVVVAQDITGWVIFNKVWSVVTDDIEQRGLRIYYPSPQTYFGLSGALQFILEASENQNDVILFLAAESATEIYLKYGKPLSELNGSDNQKAGELAFEAIFTAKEFNLIQSQKDNNVIKFLQIEAFFDFEVTDQLRMFVNIHARRSRY